MKILYVITGADIGGAQKHLLQISRWFKEEGHLVHVVTGEEGPLKNELIELGINVTVIPIPRKIEFKKDLLALLKLCSFIKKGKYNIIHSHSSKAGILARLAGFLLGVSKNVFTAHGFVFTDPTLSFKKKFFYVWLERFCSWLATDIITVSQYDYENGVKNGIQPGKMHIIHNGIPSEQIIDKETWKLKQEKLRIKKKKIVGFVGRYSFEKNIDMLIRVAELIKKNKIFDVEIWMLGDGPLYPYYKDLINRKGLGDVIDLKGNQENVIEWMDQMHSLIITSHKEGLPYVLLEAVSRGLPVVSTNVGGVEEVLGLIGAKEHLIVPINDEGLMYMRLSAILYNCVLREEIGWQLLEVSERITAVEMCEKTREVYWV